MMEFINLFLNIYLFIKTFLQISAIIQGGFEIIMYGRMYLLRGLVSQSQVGLPMWIDSEVFYCQTGAF